MGNLGHLSWIRHSRCKCSATHSYQFVQYFRVSKHCCGCQCWGFLMCAQMLIDCTWGLYGHCKTVCAESWLRDPLGEDSYAALGLKTHISSVLWLFSQMLLLSYFHPVQYGVVQFNNPWNTDWLFQLSVPKLYFFIKCYPVQLKF